MKEADLILRCQQGHANAQQYLFEQYADRLYRLAFRYVKSTVDAEDLLMTALAKIFKGMGTFSYQGEGSLEGWMRKVVVNEALMWLRRRHNFNMTESLDATLPEPDLSVFSALEAADIYAMIGQLPTGYRTIFNLHVVEGYSHTEIGTLLSINEGTSRSQLFKAKALLKKMLNQEGIHYGT